MDFFIYFDFLKICQPCAPGLLSQQYEARYLISPEVLSDPCFASGTMGRGQGTWDIVLT